MRPPVPYVFLSVTLGLDNRLVRLTLVHCVEHGQALGNLRGPMACCLRSCSLQGVKPQSLFLIHVLFSLKKKFKNLTQLSAYEKDSRPHGMFLALSCHQK